MNETTEIQPKTKKIDFGVLIKRIALILLCIDLLLFSGVGVLAMIRLWPEGTPTYAQAGQNSLSGDNEMFEKTAEIINGTDLRFSCPLTNHGTEPISLKEWTIQYYQNGVEQGELFHVAFSDFLGQFVLAPGETRPIDDNLPLRDAQERGADQFEYCFTFSDESGNSITKTFLFTLDPNAKSQNQIDYSGDKGKDLSTLRYDASFVQETYPGVFWVPARALGESDYTNAEIVGLLKNTAQQKQEQIDTLYEALQLYQIGNFYASDDNINLADSNGVIWEHHKPGYDAVRTNTGCCASSASWLNYILAEDYDEVGFIAYFGLGGGHIFNYIKEDGSYYIIDMTHYRTDWPATPVESGNLNDFAAFDPALGGIHKVAELSDFVAFLLNAGFDPPEYIYQYQAEDCLAINALFSQDGSIDFLIEQVNGVTVNTLYDVNGDGLNVSFGPGPDNRPDYGTEADYRF